MIFEQRLLEFPAMDWGAALDPGGLVCDFSNNNNNTNHNSNNINQLSTGPVRAWARSTPSLSLQVLQGATSFG